MRRPSGVRVIGRLALVVAGLGGIGGLLTVVGKRTGVEAKDVDEHVKLDTVWRTILVLGLLVVMLVVTDVWFGLVERKRDPDRSPAASLGVLATGMAVSAGITALLMLRWVLYDPVPSAPTPEEVRSRVDTMFERLIAAGGSEPPDLAGMLAGLPPPVRQACTTRFGRPYGEYLTWDHTTTSDVHGSVLLFNPHGVPGLTPEMAARVRAMAAEFGAEGFVVGQDEGFGSVGFTANARLPHRPGLTLFSFSVRLRYDAGPTYLVDIDVLASASCYRSA
ncbi:MAG: hypothetical protein ABR540_09375 [Acidimicrobiales bacterium]